MAGIAASCVIGIGRRRALRARNGGLSDEAKAIAAALKKKFPAARKILLRETGRYIRAEVVGAIRPRDSTSPRCKFLALTIAGGSTASPFARERCAIVEPASPLAQDAILFASLPATG